MSILKVSLLGCVRVTQNNWITEIKLPHEMQALLAYLLLHRRRAHPREILAAIFWGENNYDKARRALNTALWRLKKVLEPTGIPSGTYLNSSHPAAIGFNTQSQYWLDVEVFEDEITHLIPHTSQTTDDANAHKLEGVIDLYRGELLEGFYDEWAVSERERLQALYIKSLRYLMRYYKLCGAYERATDYGQQILNLDPLREDVHRAMMELYLESGQRVQAARQYAICQLTLAKELGISPMEETRALYKQIFPEVRKTRRSHISQEYPPSMDAALLQLYEVSRTIELAREQIQQAIYSVTSYMHPENERYTVEILSEGMVGRTRKGKFIPRVE